MKILKIIPYYGQWPSFMHLYLESCKANPQLDIVFVTDLPPFDNSPSNVSYFPLSLKKLKKRIEALFNLDVSNYPPYKLCDFRPAYGLIFSNLIQGYDFWGYGDNDLIYGDLSLFLKEELLRCHDILAFKKGHLQGPFTLYKNTEINNNLFKEGGHYRTVFGTSEYVSFDEFGKNVFYTKIKSLQDITSLPENNISVIALKQHLEGNLSVYTQQHVKENLSESDVIVYDKGRVYDYYTQEDYLFYHWVLEKRALWFDYPEWFKQRPEKFYITVTGFYLPDEFAKFNKLYKVRYYKGLTRWWWLKGTNFLKRRVGLPVNIDTYPKKGWVKKLS
ncbi:DUF6625 family protein [Rapidithrix thailandica]|uniref:DUF6625 family protein n=1 Tax=Rapidithrix thailandica TaxID=413964 RepID=A0AAW9RXI2_9BACT